LKVIFGKKAEDVMDASLRVPPGVTGKILATKIFVRKEKMAKKDENKKLKEIDTKLERDRNPSRRPQGPDWRPAGAAGRGQALQRRRRRAEKMFETLADRRIEEAKSRRPGTKKISRWAMSCP
jgi:DNA-directed RNA polymerase beta subunit